MTQIQALLLTLGVEVPLVLVLAAGARWADDRAALGRLLVAAVAMSLVTHPFAWTANTSEALAGWGFGPRAALIEVSVALAETLILRGFGGLTLPRAALAAWSANAASFGFGLVLWALTSG